MLLLIWRKGFVTFSVVFLYLVFNRLHICVFRRKLLHSLSPNKRQLRMWDPELIAMKQRALVSQVYGKCESLFINYGRCECINLLQNVINPLPWSGEGIIGMHFVHPSVYMSVHP